MKSINSNFLSRRFKLLPVCLLGGFFFVLSLTAQPSGGPYGPIQQTYELPDVSGRIYYVAPDGKAKASGKKLEDPTTLAAAIEKVKTGDAIVMRGGTYRTGGLLLNQGITLQPYKDEQPVLKGTLVASDWEPQGPGLWRTSWDRLFPSAPADWWVRRWHGRTTPLHRFNDDMVFVDGKFLQSAGWEGEVDENTFFINYDEGLVYIGIDPADHLVEITAFNFAIHRVTDKCHGKKSDGIGPIIRGITFTQYAYRALEIQGYFPEGLSPESEHGKDVVGTTLEHCTISFCSRVAAYLLGDSLTIRHCKVHDTSTEGIYIMSSSDVLLEKNIFSRNNIERISGYYPSAVKIFNQSYRVTCRDNLVIDLPYSNGIWYDVGNRDGVFVNNWVQDVGNPDREFRYGRYWPSDSGFFFEISSGAICAGNVFVNCDQGIYIINAADVEMVNNTLVNSSVCIMRTPRSAEGDHFGWHPSTGPDVDERDGHVFVNNLLFGNVDYHRPLLNLAQTPSLCERLTKPQIKEIHHNLYVRGPAETEDPLILWSPANNEDCQIRLNSIQALQDLNPEYGVDSKYLNDYTGPLFKSELLGNYEVLPCFSKSKTAADIPNKIKEVLGLEESDASYIGAYPDFNK